MSTPTVFIGYSHKDEIWKDRLVTHLKALHEQGRIDLWDDRRISAGDDWYQEIQSAIAAASIAILMISPDFLASHFIQNEEVPHFLERNAKEGLRIIPIIVKPCAWLEFNMLDKAWDNPKTNIISLVAWGSVGKTALVNVWLNQIVQSHYRGAERIYGYSFYSQGAAEGKQASANLFIATALAWFGDPEADKGSPWDKGEPSRSGNSFDPRAACSRLRRKGHGTRKFGQSERVDRQDGYASVGYRSEGDRKTNVKLNMITSSDLVSTVSSQSDLATCCE
jgi:hypothetical protein